jgi:hypothetical protein
VRVAFLGNGIVACAVACRDCGSAMLLIAPFGHWHRSFGVISSRGPDISDCHGMDCTLMEVFTPSTCLTRQIPTWISSRLQPSSK